MRKKLDVVPLYPKRACSTPHDSLSCIYVAGVGKFLGTWLGGAVDKTCRT